MQKTLIAILLTSLSIPAFAAGRVNNGFGFTNQIYSCQQKINPAALVANVLYADVYLLSGRNYVMDIYSRGVDGEKTIYTGKVNFDKDFHPFVPGIHLENNLAGINFYTSELPNSITASLSLDLTGQSIAMTCSPLK